MVDPISAAVAVGQIKDAVELAAAARRGMRQLVRLQPEYGPFWKAFEARARPLQARPAVVGDRRLAA
jgi:hypothetical protein